MQLWKKEKRYGRINFKFILYRLRKGESILPRRRLRIEDIVFKILRVLDFKRASDGFTRKL